MGNTVSTGVSFAGLGAVTGYGWGKDALWSGLMSSKPAARLTRVDDDGSDEMGWLARIPEGGDPADGDGLFIRSYLSSCREAIADARGRGWVPGKRVGVIRGTTFGDSYVFRDFYRNYNGSRRQFVGGILTSTAISMLMKENDFHGPATEVSATCSTGLVALITAKMWIEAGMVDDVIVSTTDLSFTPEILSGFVNLGAAVIDDEPLVACRPFQSGSRGFSPGESAITFVMSNRVDDPYMQLLGGAMTADGYHPTGMNPSFEMVKESVVSAMANAGVDSSDIRYLNAHGTGTEQCTAAEVTVLDDLFDGDLDIYALKPLVGHCLTSAATIEIAGAALAQQHKTIPAAPAVSEHHPRLIDGPTAMKDGLTLKLSMGMGGYNTAAILGSRHEGEV
ncbi:beta-ketoacyl synthase N-terminal-like domain-containing protein [Mycobacterium sp. 2YAF39]|uniref:beta-ketoacyl synthase N-terminal-like domain-containing protein n=1 Tax=Mycobacterium sp. 2YAF39 TaxID=3233033 RepID=UPI003F966DFD